LGDNELEFITNLLPYQMFISGLPFKRWPLLAHAITAGLVVITAALGAWWIRHIAAVTLQARGEELRLLQNEFQKPQRPQVKIRLENFTNTLPNIAKSDEVVRDMSRQAQAMNVQITSLTVAPSEPSPTTLKKIQFNLAANGDYRSVKRWLSELLDRYPSLGVQTLSMRALPTDARRQESQIVLIMFVKD
jgi:Type II secretion system (T2SS), protein M subtype b